MINVAFRLPEVSVRYLHKLILDAHNSGKSISSEDLCNEIAFRERSHQISECSAYASLSSSLSLGVPPSDTMLVPPLVTSIQSGSIASFPLRYNHAETYLGEGTGSRTVLIGDAAHTIHPLAGQGLNLGLDDVECLVRCIAQSISCGGDIGLFSSLLTGMAVSWFGSRFIHYSPTICGRALLYQS